MSRGGRRHAKELALALGVYVALAVAVSWPLVRGFSTHLLGDVWYDQRHSLWLLWHVKEALLGRQPWFTADLLFYPYGVSTLVDGVGTFSGLLALPFWPFGPAAAYNGTTVAGLALSGWCMYLLVRYGGLSVAGDARTPLLRLDALFAGIVFLLFPIHLSALYGHIEKVFIGLLPLSVLAGLLAYDQARGRAWLCAPGVALLLALLHNGNQFQFALLALVLLAILSAVTRETGVGTPASESGDGAPASGAGEPTAVARRFVIVWPVVRRGFAAGAIALAIVGPMLLAVGRVARDPAMHIASAVDSTRYQPDLLNFAVPAAHQATVGRLFYRDEDLLPPDYTRASIVPSLNPTPTWVGSGIETAVTLPISVLALACIACIALFTRRAAASGWLLFGGLFVLLAIGPVLRVAGRTTFTLYNLPLMLPYAVLTSCPGFDVMRTPGRFMMIAAVGIAILAALGLRRVMARLPHRALPIAIVATLVVALECWPRVWPQQMLPPVPAFYEGLAQDSARYGVLDLPSARWRPDLASGYMYYQMTHRKGIAWAYLSRQFVRYRVYGLEGVLDDQPPNAAYTRARLVELGYRYVVWHKRAADLFGGQRPDSRGGARRAEPAADKTNASALAASAPTAGAPATGTPNLGTPAAGAAPAGTPGVGASGLDAQSNAFIREAFTGVTPIVDDDLVTVYRIQP